MKLRPVAMKLSDKTLSLLKNFSTINQSILFKQGSKLRTISVMKNILAEATVDEELPKDFGIYDLNQFLNGLGLHQSPELDFENDGHVVIKEGKMRSKYFFADPQVIITPPDKEITLPTEDVSFELSTQQLDKLLKAAGIYQLPDLAVIGEAGVVKLLVRDKKNDTSNVFSLPLKKVIFPPSTGQDGEFQAPSSEDMTKQRNFCHCFKVENLKLIDSSYHVTLSGKNIANFTSLVNSELNYFVALEPN